MHGNFKDEPVLMELAAKYGKSAAQIALRWNLQNEVAIIPKSVTQSRIIENSQIFDFELTREDMKTIDALNRDQRFLPDPDTR